MLSRNSKNFSRTTLQKLLYAASQPPAFPHAHIQSRSYVDVYMKWKKDSYLDSVEAIHKSTQLRPIISLKNCILAQSQDDDNRSVPISALSKRGQELDIPIKVARFLRQYPSFFEEFTGPKYNLPWFRLTQRAIQLDIEENQVYETFKSDLVDRVKRLVSMSAGVEKAVPLKIIQGLQWYLGLPEDFSRVPEKYIGDDERFCVIEMEDGLRGLAVVGSQDNILSVLQRNALRKGVYNGGKMEMLEFPMFPTKGLRLKSKIANWLEEFKRLPYVSPYEDVSGLNPDSDVAEKRVVGVLHELLSMFVEHAAERKKLLILRKYLGLPQKVHKAFERHPSMFYLSLRNKTCTAILKEAYYDKGAIHVHPLAEVRKKYINLMKESEVILKSRRVNNIRHYDDHTGLDKNVAVKDLDCTDDERIDMTEASV